MSRIFLSHSSADEREAVALKQWLADNGWNDVFLDVDPQRGLAAGERWQEALRQAADRCQAVVLIVSPGWPRSKWCLAEFLLAKSLHKLIFGVVLKEVPIGELPTEMTAEWQLCRLVGNGSTETLHFRLVGECNEGGDTLPLLGLTLARLYRDYGSDGELRLDEYQAMGGLAKIVKTEAESDPDVTQPGLDALGLADVKAADVQTLDSIAHIGDMQRVGKAFAAQHVLLPEGKGGKAPLPPGEGLG